MLVELVTVMTVRMETWWDRGEAAAVPPLVGLPAPMWEVRRGSQSLKQKWQPRKATARAAVSLQVFQLVEQRLVRLLVQRVPQPPVLKLSLHLVVSRATVRPVQVVPVPALLPLVPLPVTTTMTAVDPRLGPMGVLLLGLVPRMILPEAILKNAGRLVVMVVVMVLPLLLLLVGTPRLAPLARVSPLGLQHPVDPLVARVVMVMAAKLVTVPQHQRDKRPQKHNAR